MSFYTNALYHESESDQEPISDKGILDCSSMLDIPEHRSGWNYVKRLCNVYLHDPSAPILVDFVEKIWCWKDFSLKEKDIYYENESYIVPAERVKMINGKEYALLNETTAVFWNGRDWTKSDLDTDLVRAADVYGIFTTPWIGMIHNPVDMPVWFDYCNSPQELLRKELFQKSLQFCRGLIVFSEDLKHKLLQMGGWPCEIDVVTHPTEPSLVRWKKSPFNCIAPFHRNRLVQVGYWLRRLSSIWEVKVPNKKRWKKYWINRAEHGFSCLEKEIYNENLIKKIICNKDRVNVLSLSNDAYDDFLSKSVMFVDLYDSSCNNTIIEAIVRHVPILVRRLKSTEEYLGKDYCLFFESLEEVPELLNNPERVQCAHEQLKCLEKSGCYYGNHFVRQMRQLSFVNPEKYSHVSNVISFETFFDFEYSYETICQLLSRDFANLTSGFRLMINGNGQIEHRDYKHLVFKKESETPNKLLDYARNDFEKLKDIQDKKVEQFQTRFTENCLFVLFHNEYPTELCEILKTKLNSFKILTINRTDGEYTDQPTNVEHGDFLFYTIKNTDHADRIQNDIIHRLIA
jgi:hypothetical protein